MIFLCVVALNILGTYPDEPTSPAQTYQAILQDFEDSKAHFKEMLKSVKTQEDLEKALKKHPNPTPDHIYAQLIDLARKYPNDPAAVDALAWVVAKSTHGFDDYKEQGRWVRQAVDMMILNYVDDERVGRTCLDVCRRVNPNAEFFIQNVFEKTKNKAVKQRATLAWGIFLAKKAELSLALNDINSSYLMQLIEKNTPYRLNYIRGILKEDEHKLKAESEALLETVVAEFADLKCDFILPAKYELDITMAELADTELWRLQNLTVGQKAPDIEGIDSENKPFKLSDYRGKIVYLTFSGNWCGPCVAKYPWERELVKKYQGKPFAMLSVNTDPEIKTLQEAIKEGEITWRCWWQKSPEGPITQQWLIDSFPTEYIIDEHGVIRAIELVTKDATEYMIDQLMEKLDSPDEAK